MRLDPSRPRPSASARTAVSLSFFLAGLGFATWASRLPAIRVSLDLDPGELGLLLLAIAAGSVIALPMSGAVAARIGTARAVLLGGGLTLSGLSLAGIAASAVESVPLTAVGLFVLGAGNGLWDVSMNLEGAVVERRYGRAIMPSFHAAFSLGTVIAAGIGALAAWGGTPTAVHLSSIAVLSAAALALSVRRFTSAGSGPRAGAAQDRSGAGPADGRSPRPSALSAWGERRTILIGVLVLSAAFTEGSANDWLAVALVDGYGASEAVGAAGFAVFLSAMTAARLAGQPALDRWGRVVVLRATMVAGAAGAALVVFGGSLPMAVLGALIWGAGAAMGFPVGISAAADDPARAAARVSVVTTLGYTAFLAGPPLLGLLGDDLGVLRALLVVALLAIPSLLVSGVAAPLPQDADADGVERPTAPPVGSAAHRT